MRPRRAPARRGATGGAHVEPVSKLHALGTRLLDGRVTEDDAAAAAEQELLAVQLDLALALERAERAVGAVVDEHVLVAAALDARVHPRRLAIGDDDVVRAVAAERERPVALVELDPALAVAQREVRLASCPPRGQRGQVFFGPLPEQLEDLDVRLLAPHRVHVLAARADLERHRQLFERLRRHQRLAALGERTEPGGQVDRVAVEIRAVLEHRAAVEPRVDRQPHAAFAGELGDAAMHVDRRVTGVAGAREHGHHLVADRLDDAAVAVLARGPHDVDAATDERQRDGVTRGLVEARAAGHVGEQDGGVMWRVVHDGASVVERRV